MMTAVAGEQCEGMQPGVRACDRRTVLVANLNR